MAELRRDPIVGRWVIINTEDSMTPDDFEKEDQTPKHQATCQFCYGREHQTPPEIEASRAPGTAPNTPGWSVRVVPNKFPALRIEGNIDRRGMGVFTLANGIGAHEVVIETPDHNKALADLSKEEFLEVIRKFCSRSWNLAQDKRFKYIIIFKNFGGSAGTSVEHGHSQIIALPMVPKHVLEELEGARRYHELRERCIFCDVIQQEYQDKERIVVENKNFVVFCPYVPRYAFECWVLPKRHIPHFFEMSEEEQHDLSLILKEALWRIKSCLFNPSYNFFIHTAPVNQEYTGSYHWHIEIVPKLTREAGFEWGTGFYVVPTAPQIAAKFLKEVKFNFQI